jgi:hypothetical protein
MPQQPLDYQTLGGGPPRRLPVMLQAIRRWWPVAMVLAAAVLFGLWEMFARHVDEGRPGSRAEVTAFTSVPPPPQAAKIWVASYGEGPMAFSHYVRFEAPPAVCRAYAAAVVPGATLSRPDDNSVALDLEIFKNMSWFDLGQATTLVGARGSMPRPNIHVWVDTTRGVFYFMETD